MPEHGASHELSSLLDDVVQGKSRRRLLRLLPRRRVDAAAASKVPAKRRAVSIKPSVEALASLAYDGGILPEDLSRLVELITTTNHLDQASLAALAKNLYPVGNVGDEVVLRVVGCLGHGHLKPSLVIQGLLLRWLVLVYHVLDNPAVLSQAYAVLFNLLDTAAIRQVGTRLRLAVPADTRQASAQPSAGTDCAEKTRPPLQDPSHVGSYGSPLSPVISSRLTKQTHLVSANRSRCVSHRLTPRLQELLSRSHCWERREGERRLVQGKLTAQTIPHVLRLTESASGPPVAYKIGRASRCSPTLPLAVERRASVWIPSESPGQRTSKWTRQPRLSDRSHVPRPRSKWFVAGQAAGSKQGDRLP